MGNGSAPGPLRSPPLIWEAKWKSLQTLFSKGGARENLTASWDQPSYVFGSRHRPSVRLWPSPWHVLVGGRVLRRLVLVSARSHAARFFSDMRIRPGSCRWRIPRLVQARSDPNCHWNTSGSCVDGRPRRGLGRVGIGPGAVPRGLVPSWGYYQGSPIRGGGSGGQRWRQFAYVGLLPPPDVATSGDLAEGGVFSPSIQ